MGHLRAVCAIAPGAHPPSPRHSEEPLRRQWATEWRAFGPAPSSPSSTFRHLYAGQTAHFAIDALPVKPGDKSGNNSVERRFWTKGTAIWPNQDIYTPSELRLYPATALSRKTFVARIHTRNRATQACDLRFYGAPKGIRIPKVLVTIGTRWDSLVQRSCGESQ